MTCNRNIIEFSILCPLNLRSKKASFQYVETLSFCAPSMKPSLLNLSITSLTAINSFSFILCILTLLPLECPQNAQ